MAKETERWLDAVAKAVREGGRLLSATAGGSGFFHELVAGGWLSLRVDLGTKRSHLSDFLRCKTGLGEMGGKP